MLRKRVRFGGQAPSQAWRGLPERTTSGRASEANRILSEESGWDPLAGKGEGRCEPEVQSAPPVLKVVAQGVYASWADTGVWVGPELSSRWEPLRAERVGAGALSG